MAQATVERHCTLLICNNAEKDTANTRLEDLTKAIEDGSIEEKRNAIKTAIRQLMQGEDLSDLLMIVIRYLVSTNDHELKKLLSLYWETVNKYDQDGKLRSEMLLVCNALMKDLQHANEFIAGCSLRFLCRIHEVELIEPLLPAIKENLKHTHPYVRANAALAVWSVFKSFPEIIPEAAELIESFLEVEMDNSARRNGFLVLFNIDHARATAYLLENFEQVDKFGDGFQLVVLDLARKMCRLDPNQKSRFVRVIFQLMQSDDASVSYEAALTLVALSSAPTAVRAAAATFCQLLVNHSDNNVKLIVLDRIGKLRKMHLKVLQELVMDVLRALRTPDVDIRRRTLEIAVDLCCPRNINEVMVLFKKELSAVQGTEEASKIEYRQQLIKAIHTCAVKFPNVIDSVLGLLMDFLTLEDKSGLAVVKFIRELLHSNEAMRPQVLSRLTEILPTIPNHAVAEVVLWMLGEYCEQNDIILGAFKAIQKSVGPLPLSKEKPAKEETKTAEGDASGSPEGAEAGAEKAPAPAAGPVVLADGSYASQTATEAPAAAGDDEAAPEETFRRLLLNGHHHLSTAAGLALTKLSLRVAARLGDAHDASKGIIVDSLSIICACLHYGRTCKEDDFSKFSRVTRMPDDQQERLSACVSLLLDPDATELRQLFLTSSRDAFGAFLKNKEEKKKNASKNEETDITIVEPDHIINFRQLRPQAKLGSSDIDLDDDADISKATGAGGDGSAAGPKKRVQQLTGFSDSIYAEATVTVHDYDLVLEILLINRTSQVLVDVSVELFTMGDLKVVDRPQSFALAPGGTHQLKTSVKVSSTETGFVFGTISYLLHSARHTINISDIHVDIMDYIKPATCPPNDFRRMWAEFEWENKVAVSTNLTDLQAYLDNIMKVTNMTCLTPMDLDPDCPFLAANLYARSLFGEDALVNIAITRVEEVQGPKITGYIRIRSKTQGIALSLGNRMNLKQRVIGYEEEKQAAASQK